MILETRDDVAGPILSRQALHLEVSKDGFVRGTRLIPVHVLYCLENLQLRPEAASYFLSPLERLRSHLAAAVASRFAFPPGILASIATTFREQIAPAGLVELAYLNSVVVSGGLNASMSPWLIGYAALRLGIKSGANVAVLGGGNGYSTAVFATLAGPAGLVTVYEVDRTVALQLSSRLTKLQTANVRVARQDVMAYNFDTAEQYDVMFATLSVKKIPKTWLRLLRPNGIIGAFLPSEAQASRQCLKHEWWQDVRFVVFEKKGNIRPVSSLTGLYNPPMRNQRESLPISRHWYPDALRIQNDLISEVRKITGRLP